MRAPISCRCPEENVSPYFVDVGDAGELDAVHAGEALGDLAVVGGQDVDAEEARLADRIVRPPQVGRDILDGQAAAQAFLHVVDFEKALAFFEADLLMLGATLGTHVPRVEQAIRCIRERCERPVRVVVGGAAHKVNGQNRTEADMTKQLRTVAYITC